jgi:anti-sigma B factor antagonist
MASTPGRDFSSLSPEDAAQPAPAMCTRAAACPQRSRPLEVMQMPEASFRVEVVGGVPVVVAPEEIDITNTTGLRAALLEAAAHGNRTLVADMSQTQFCDSAGLNVLVRAHKRARAEGGELLLVIRAAAVLRIFAVTGIDQLVPTFPDLEQALRQTPPSVLPGSPVR